MAIKINMDSSSEHFTLVYLKSALKPAYQVPVYDDRLVPFNFVAKYLIMFYFHKKELLCEPKGAIVVSDGPRNNPDNAS